MGFCQPLKKKEGNKQTNEKINHLVKQLAPAAGCPAWPYHQPPAHSHGLENTDGGELGNPGTCHRPQTSPFLLPLQSAASLKPYPRLFTTL